MRVFEKASEHEFAIFLFFRVRFLEPGFNASRPGAACLPAAAWASDIRLGGGNLNSPCLASRR